jgi:hypothetical protein
MQATIWTIQPNFGFTKLKIGYDFFLFFLVLLVFLNLLGEVWEILQKKIY